MTSLRLGLALACLFVGLSSGAALAQGVRMEGEGAYGGTWFVDESPIPHKILGGALKWRVSPRVSIGPEMTYMVGPGSDRDLTLTGNVTFDIRPAGVTPFLVAGGGLFRHSERFSTRTFTSTEGGFTGGGGVRIPLPSGWYLAPEARLGWELHTRFHVAVGRRF